MLADWFVQIRVDGADKAKKDIDDTGKKLDGAEKKASKFGATMVSAFTKAGIVAGGLVLKGIAGTEEWDRFTGAVDRLAEQLASTFLPVIELITGAVEATASAFEALDAHGQTAILGITAAAATLLTVLTGGLLPALVAIGAALGFAVNIAQGEDRPRSQVNKKPKDTERSRFESVDAVFKRIQESIAGGSVAKEQLKKLDQIEKNTRISKQDLKPIQQEWHAAWGIV